MILAINGLHSNLRETRKLRELRRRDYNDVCGSCHSFHLDYDLRERFEVDLNSSRCGNEAKTRYAYVAVAQKEASENVNMERQVETFH